MRIFRLLLFPFSILYGAVVWLRNKLYDWKIFKSAEFDIPIISVGNLEVGGSGKTPLVEYLIQLLKADYKLATLSRGYGRKTKGFRWVTENDNAALSGDEPLQIKNKFPDISVAVCEDRVLGIAKIKAISKVILMDDAYQHRAVKPGFSILLFDYNRLNDAKLLLPTGNYRENFAGRKRADLIIITKTPHNLSVAEQEKAENSIRKYPHQKLLFSSISYSGQLFQIFDQTSIPVNEIKNDLTVILITGIAKSELLYQEIEKYTSKIIHHKYADHHQFSQKNMLKLVADFEANAVNTIIITTQKDAVRLRSQNSKPVITHLPIYEWPIEVAFSDYDKQIFNTEILNYVKTH